MCEMTSEKANESKIRTVIFDIGHVLVDYDWSRKIQERYDEEKAGKLIQAIFGTGYWNEMDRGVVGPEEVLEKALSVCPEYEEELADAVYNVGTYLHKMPYAIPWIKELKEAGYQVLYLSNYSEFIMKANMGALDFLPYVDGGVFSCFVNLTKPEPEIYYAICEVYHLDPAACLFIDDMLPNVEAARACGLNAIQFKGYEQSYPVVMEWLKEH